MSVFVHAQGIKTVHAGGGGKKWQHSVHVVVECPLSTSIWNYPRIRKAIVDDLTKSFHFVTKSKSSNFPFIWKVELFFCKSLKNCPLTGIKKYLKVASRLKYWTLKYLVFFDNQENSSRVLMKNDLISYDLISYDLISYDIISYDIISYDIISYDLISFLLCTLKINVSGCKSLKEKGKKKRENSFIILQIHLSSGSLAQLIFNVSTST